jgi:hypothetical protein
MFSVKKLDFIAALMRRWSLIKVTNLYVQDLVKMVKMNDRTPLWEGFGGTCH